MYKRQGKSVPGGGRSSRTLLRDGFILARCQNSLDILERRAGCVSVSYTHLDVYKRQVVYEIVCRTIIAERRGVRYVYSSNLQNKRFLYGQNA